MYLNNLTIDMMIMVYVIGLFFLILVCLYALIQSKANKLYTFIIIPLALVMASMTWQAVTALQGLPIYGFPDDKKIEVMFVHDSKPWIYVLLNNKKSGPMFYKIDWSKSNQKKIQELKNKIGTTGAQGTFKKTNQGESKSFIFVPMDDLSGYQPKDGEEDSGVIYTTTGTPNVNGTTTTVPRLEQTNCPDSQNFCDDEEPAVVFTRTREVPGWSPRPTGTRNEYRDVPIGEAP